MFFFALPDALPQAVEQESVVLVADASTSSSKSTARKATFGVCEFAYANLKTGEYRRGDNHAITLDKQNLSLQSLLMGAKDALVSPTHKNDRQQP
jgi:hypothetical protein